MLPSALQTWQSFRVSKGPSSVRKRSSIRKWSAGTPTVAALASIGARVAIGRRSSEKSEILQIVSQMRKLESIGALSVNNQPKKSTRPGLAAMNDLEELLEGDCEFQALGASLQQDKTALGEIVMQSLQLLREQTGKDVDVGEVTKIIAGLLETNPGEEVSLLPPCDDATENAQNARWPQFPALEQICRHGSLGACEAPVHRASKPKEIPLTELLSKAGLEGPVIGEDQQIDGVVDVIERAMPGDLLLLSPGSDEDIFLDTQEADRRGVSAIALVGDFEFSKMEKLFSRCSGESLKALVSLPESLQNVPVPVELTRAFFGSSGVKKVAVVGDDLDIRTASWILFKLMGQKVGLINERCSFVGEQLGIFGQLSVCAVEEMMADANDWCVAEVPSSSTAFDYVDFDVVLDLGGQRKIDAPLLISPQDSDSRAKVTFSEEVLSEYVDDVMEEYAQMTKQELADELMARGVEVSEKALKKDLLQGLQLVLEDQNASVTPRGNDPNGSNLHVAFTAIDLHGLQVQISGLKVQTSLSLPWLGSIQAISGAICAAIELGISGEVLEARLKAIEAPPATLEICAVNEETFGMLHEASRPCEVAKALQMAASVAPKALTAVFGCDECSQGDRAKIAWALAEHCNRIVLTTRSTGSQQAMQIIEEMLDAIKGTPKTSLEVFVVVDRADAIKFASAAKDSLVLVFGSSHQDFYEACDEEGEKAWLCNDRRVLMESFQLRLPLPPHARTKGFLYPGRSLHSSYNVQMASDGLQSQL